ncbi:T6SS immunity protein Tdi1 domain-containing protein [Microbulbifer sp. JMSA003]|uniref:T6SS immunity protein Tdi1 domain-containing protein n=1 Tax=Microbulbifer sp. JMSA003 TaxID=3243369 RepID=UPI004039BC76
MLSCFTVLISTPVRKRICGMAHALTSKNILMTLNDLTVNFSHINKGDFLSDWEWLIGKGKLPIVITALGDAFIQNVKTNEVEFLSTTLCQVEFIAKDGEEFLSKLQDSEFVSGFMGAKFVRSLIESGKSLSKYMIYSIKIPLFLGGEIDVENFEITDIEVHFSISGQFHKKVQGLPEGTPIESVTLAKPKRKSWWKF